MSNAAPADTAETVKVVITTHNRRAWARQAIESALAQSYQRVHIVIVDDASDDGTAEMAREFSERCPDRITSVLKRKNAGVADSVRIGLTVGPQTDYVALLNDDDLWYPSFLERTVSLLSERTGSMLVYAECDVVDESLAATNEVFSDLFGRFQGADFRDALRANHASASTLIFTADIAARAARTMPAELDVFDYYIVLLAAGYGQILGIAEPLAVYRKTTDGLHTHSARAWRDTTRARHHLFEANPDLVERVGGRRQARREVGLRTLDVALLQLRGQNIREYLWHSAWIVRLGQPRIIGWLALHSLGSLRRRSHPRNGDPATGSVTNE